VQVVGAEALVEALHDISCLAHIYRPRTRRVPLSSFTSVEQAGVTSSERKWCPAECRPPSLPHLTEPSARRAVVAQRRGEPLLRQSVG
jgi:hypothetical protein